MKGLWKLTHFTSCNKLSHSGIYIVPSLDYLILYTVHCSRSELVHLLYMYNKCYTLAVGFIAPIHTCRFTFLCFFLFAIIINKLTWGESSRGCGCPLTCRLRTRPHLHWRDWGFWRESKGGWGGKGVLNIKTLSNETPCHLPSSKAQKQYKHSLHVATWNWNPVTLYNAELG